MGHSLKYRNNLQLALDIRRGQWLLHDAEAMLPAALNFLEKMPVSLDVGDCSIAAYTENGEPLAIDSEQENPIVVVIPIVGTITKYDSCGTIGAMTIAETIVSAGSRENTLGVVLDIDSGGGACNAVHPITEAISKVQMMGKPIIAHCDLCASAAYWIASQCDAVFADNSLSLFGSIGVMTQLVDNRSTPDGSRLITIYAKESPDKNLAYRHALEGDCELAQAEMSPIVSAFHDAVRQGRPSLKEHAAEVLTGKTFRAAQAIALGLADDLLSLEDAIQNVFIRSKYC